MNKWTLLRALLPSIYFNFKYLPFRQAVRLPILIYRPHFLTMRGMVQIDSEKIQFGMIKLGFLTSKVYPNTGVTLCIEGLIIFKGTCKIGNGSHIVVGKNGKLVFGSDFVNTAQARIVSNIGITFGEHCRLGWDSLVMDTNFHPIYNIEKKKFNKAFGRIDIGDNNWFGTGCMIMHSVTTPERCIFGAKTVVTRGGQYESYCVHAGSPIRIVSRNVMRIIGQDSVKDYSEDDRLG